VARGRSHLQGILAPAALSAVTGALLLMPVLAFMPVLSAQDVTEPALKAAYIYNFAKFTEWPTGAVPSAEPLLMCVLGDPAVGDALARAVKGRTLLAGQKMAVSDVPLKAPAGPQRACHVLYVSGVTSDQAKKVIAAVRDVPVLTISDIDGFTEIGGIAQFFFEHGQLRFSVHLGSVKRARLQISSRLLILAELK
jgi:hypothetical protein